VQIADMPPEMIEYAKQFAFNLLQNRRHLQRDIAERIKKEFDKKYGPTWHCIVGTDFGSYVAHEMGTLVYFDVGETSILLWRA